MAKQPTKQKTNPKLGNSITNPITRKKATGQTGQKRSEAQRAADMDFFEHWHIRGKTERQLAMMIAEIRPYTLSRVQINADLKVLKERWKESAIEQRSAAVARELVGLRAQEIELWEAWDRSKKDSQTKTTETEQAAPSKKKGSKKGKRALIKERIALAGQTGENAYQKLILDIRLQRRQLLGLDPPKTLEHVGEAGGPMEFIVRVAENELPKPKEA